MKWPRVLGMPPEVADQLEQRLAAFIEEDISPDGGSDGTAVQNLILDLYSIATSHLGSDTEEVRLMELIFRGLEWDTEDPHLVHAQKYINRLFASRLDDAHAYIDKAHAGRIEADAAAGASAIASAGASGGRKRHRQTTKAKEAALRYYAEHRGEFRSKKEAAITLSELFPPVTMSTYGRLLRERRRKG